MDGKTSLSLTKNETRYVTQKHEHKGHGQEHKMWKTNAKSDLYYLNLHEKVNNKNNKTRL